jgi:putative methyltransferase
MGVAGDEIAEGCIRCCLDDERGTMGFFVAGFAREGGRAALENVEKDPTVSDAIDEASISDEAEWNGFSDSELG